MFVERILSITKQREINDFDAQFAKKKEKIRIEIAHVGNIDADFGFVYKGIGKLCKDQAIIRTRQSHAQSRWEQKWTSQPTTQLQWLE